MKEIERELEEEEPVFDSDFWEDPIKVMALLDLIFLFNPNDNKPLT